MKKTRKSTRKKHYTDEQVALLLIDARGNLSAAARGMGISRKSLYERISHSALLQETLVDARETMLDNAESTLYLKALAGNTVELLFFLKTQGRSRGYIEKVDQYHSGPDGGPILTATMTVDQWKAEREKARQEAEELQRSIHGIQDQSG